jgi:hypothetical protein
VTFFGLLLTPVFYLVIRRLAQARRRAAALPGALVQAGDGRS